MNLSARDAAHGRDPTNAAQYVQQHDDDQQQNDGGNGGHACETERIEFDQESSRVEGEREVSALRAVPPGSDPDIRPSSSVAE